MDSPCSNDSQFSESSATPCVPLEGSTANVQDAPHIPFGGVLINTKFIAPSQQMVLEEQELQLAVVVSVGGLGRPAPVISASLAAQAIRSNKLLPCSSFTISPFWPENFLVTCCDLSTKKLLLEPSTVLCSGFTLSIKPWTRHAGAVARSTEYVACLELSGIPAHAWDERTAEILISDFGFLERVSPESLGRIDMSNFRIIISTRSPGLIPTHTWLEIPEQTDAHGNLDVMVHDNMLNSTKDTLAYPVCVKVDWIHRLSGEIEPIQGPTTSMDCDGQQDDGTTSRGEGASPSSGDADD